MRSTKVSIIIFSYLIKDKMFCVKSAIKMYITNYYYYYYYVFQWHSKLFHCPKISVEILLKPLSPQRPASCE